MNNVTPRNCHCHTNLCSSDGGKVIGAAVGVGDFARSALG
jgi:hypothetical protein